VVNLVFIVNYSLHNHGIGAVDGSLTHTKRSLCRELSAQVWLWNGAHALWRVSLLMVSMGARVRWLSSLASVTPSVWVLASAVG
jgi:hypothetical protein